MYFHVSSKISCFWICIIALCALVWRLFTVGEYMWLFRFPARPNEPPHSAHLCTFSPVWVIMCLLNVPASPKDYSHSEQLWIFTPLWVSMCVFRLVAWANDFWYWTQGNARSLLCVTMWLFSFLDRSNDLWHSEQLCILFPLSVSEYHSILLWFGSAWISNTQYRDVCQTRRSEHFLEPIT